jgi:hypothetical protein
MEQQRQPDNRCKNGFEINLLEIEVPENGLI